TGAGGGGISKRWPMPSWQRAPGVPGALSSGSPCANATGNCREVPDVSAAASPYNGYVVYYGGAWTVFGGTSAAAPLWGALTALVDEGCSARVGFLNPALYGAANAGVIAVNDVTQGNNDAHPRVNLGKYAAGSGYDMASGLGTPIGCQLSGLLCQPTVTTISPASGPTSGHTQVTLTGTGFRSGATTVSFGGSPALAVTVGSATSLVATAPLR